MKKSKCALMLLAVIFSLTFLGSSCETSDPVVGSEVGITVINHVSFTITDLETSSSSLTASGTVKNTGSSTITPT